MKVSNLLVTAIAILALLSVPALADNTSVFKPDRASRLIGASAIDPDGQVLGTVSDLVIADDNQLSYVVVAKADDSAYVAIPFDAAAPQVNPAGDVVLSIPKNDFDSAPSFASNNWPNFAAEPRGEARGYRSDLQGYPAGYKDAWEGSDFNRLNGISTLNPYPF